MMNVTLPKLTGTDRLNAEVLVEVIYPEADPELELDEISRHSLGTWDRMVPEPGDIRPRRGLKPGERYVIRALIHTMADRYIQVHETVGRVGRS